MDKIIKGTLHPSLNILMYVAFFILILNSGNAYSGQEIVLRKYGYGRIDWGDKVTDLEKPEIYPLQESRAYEQLLVVYPNMSILELFPYYSISDIENETSQIKEKLKVRLSVQQKAGKVIAIITFHNISNKDYYIHRGRIPRIQYDHVFGPLCDASFLITSDNVRLDYMGKYCEFESDTPKDDWYKISAGGNFSTSVILNFAYEFLPGIHKYDIGSVEYSVVNESWFIDKNIYKSIVSIIDDPDLCNLKHNGYTMEEINSLCGFDESNKNGIKYFMERFNIDAINKENHFEIRTNQVSIEIDGDKVTYHHYKH